MSLLFLGYSRDCTFYFRIETTSGVKRKRDRLEITSVFKLWMLSLVDVEILRCIFTWNRRQWRCNGELTSNRNEEREREREKERRNYHDTSVLSLAIGERRVSTGWCSGLKMRPSLRLRHSMQAGGIDWRRISSAVAKEQKRKRRKPVSFAQLTGNPLSCWKRWRN